MVDENEPQKTLDSFDFDYAVYDSQTGCWIGDKTGPKRYRNTVVNGFLVSGDFMARAAATVMNEMFGEGCRFRGGLFCGGSMRERDTITAKYTGEEAIIRIEGHCKLYR